MSTPIRVARALFSATFICSAGIRFSHAAPLTPDQEVAFQGWLTTQNIFSGGGTESYYDPNGGNFTHEELLSRFRNTPEFRNAGGGSTAGPRPGGSTGGSGPGGQSTGDPTPSPGPTSPSGGQSAAGPPAGRDSAAPPGGQPRGGPPSPAGGTSASGGTSGATPPRPSTGEEEKKRAAIEAARKGISGAALKVLDEVKTCAGAPFGETCRQGSPVPGSTGQGGELRSAGSGPAIKESLNIVPYDPVRKYVDGDMVWGAGGNSEKSQRTLFRRNGNDWVEAGYRIAGVAGEKNLGNLFFYHGDAKPGPNNLHKDWKENWALYADVPGGNKLASKYKDVHIPKRAVSVQELETPVRQGNILYTHRHVLDTEKVVRKRTVYDSQGNNSEEKLLIRRAKASPREEVRRFIDLDGKEYHRVSTGSGKQIRSHSLSASKPPELKPPADKKESAQPWDGLLTWWNSLRSEPAKQPGEPKAAEPPQKTPIEKPAAKTPPEPPADMPSVKANASPTDDTETEEAPHAGPAPAPAKPASEPHAEAKALVRQILGQSDQDKKGDGSAGSIKRNLEGFHAHPRLKGEILVINSDLQKILALVKDPSADPNARHNAALILPVIAEHQKIVVDMRGTLQAGHDTNTMNAIIRGLADALAADKGIYSPPQGEPSFQQTLATALLGIGPADKRGNRPGSTTLRQIAMDVNKPDPARLWAIVELSRARELPGDDRLLSFASNKAYGKEMSPWLHDQILSGIAKSPQGGPHLVNLLRGTNFEADLPMQAAAVKALLGTRGNPGAQLPTHWSGAVLTLAERATGNNSPKARAFAMDSLIQMSRTAPELLKSDAARSPILSTLQKGAEDPDEKIALAALAGLTVIGGGDAGSMGPSSSRDPVLSFLRRTLDNSNVSPSRRTQAASTLATVVSPTDKELVFRLAYLASGKSNPSEELQATLKSTLSGRAEIATLLSKANEILAQPPLATINDESRVFDNYLQRFKSATSR